VNRDFIRSVHVGREGGRKGGRGEERGEEMEGKVVEFINIY